MKWEWGASVRKETKRLDIRDALVEPLNYHGWWWECRSIRLGIYGQRVLGISVWTGREKPIKALVPFSPFLYKWVRVAAVEVKLCQFWEQRTQGRLPSLLCSKKGGLFDSFSCLREKIGWGRAAGQVNAMWKVVQGLEGWIRECFCVERSLWPHVTPEGKGKSGRNCMPEMMQKSCNCLRLYFLPLGRMGLEMEFEF